MIRAASKQWQRLKTTARKDKKTICIHNYIHTRLSPRNTEYEERKGWLQKKKRKQSPRRVARWRTIKLPNKCFTVAYFPSSDVIREWRDYGSHRICKLVARKHIDCTVCCKHAYTRPYTWRNEELNKEATVWKVVATVYVTVVRGFAWFVRRLLCTAKVDEREGKIK